jgi:TRAP-type C4-dicarboxylate transport system substrate-binding protein
MNRMPNLRILGVALAFLSASAAAQAADLTFKLGSHLTATAPGVVQGTQIFIGEVERLTNKSITFQFYPAEQAGKAAQMFDLVKSGAVDMGVISSGLVTGDKLPLIGMWEIPGLATSVCNVVKAMDTLGAPGGAVFESDFKRNGMRFVSYMPYPPYGPAASRKQITKVEDLQGMKMRNAGGLMELTVQKVGGVPVKMGSPEVYQALQRGTLDTVLFSFLSVKSYDLQSVTKYGVTGYSFGTPGDLLAISERRFQSLTKEQQAAVLEAGQKTSQHWCKYVDESETKDIMDIKAAGMNIYTWTPADVQKLNALTQEIPNDWAKTLDARGLPASKTLASFKELMAK